MLGGRIQWALTAQWKVWVTGSVQIDLQAAYLSGGSASSGARSTLSGAFAAGFRTHF